MDGLWIVRLGLPRTRDESYTERTCLSFIGMTLKEREWIRLKIKTALFSDKYSSEEEIQLLPPTWQPVVEPTELSNLLVIGTSGSVGANSTQRGIRHSSFPSLLKTVWRSTTLPLPTRRSVVCVKRNLRMRSLEPNNSQLVNVVLRHVAQRNNKKQFKRGVSISGM